MPPFNLFDAIASLRDLDPFVLIAYPLALILVIGMGLHARARNRREQADTEANDRRAAFERAQRDQRVFTSIKGNGPGRAA